MSDSTSPGTGRSTIAPAHAAAFAAVWVFGFLILRIFAVSGYDWDTAFVVSTTLSLNDGVSLLFGSLMAGQALTAVLLVCVLPLLVAGSVWGPNDHRPVLVLLAALGFVLATALTISSGIWWLLPATALLLAILALTRRLRPGGLVRRATAIAVGSVGWLAPMALLLVAALVQTPWVPQESIVTTEGPITGYVLSVDSGYLNVLTDRQEFVILVSTDVISRE